MNFKEPWEPCLIKVVWNLYAVTLTVLQNPNPTLKQSPSFKSLIWSLTPPENSTFALDAQGHNKTHKTKNRHIISIDIIYFQCFRSPCTRLPIRRKATFVRSTSIFALPRRPYQNCPHTHSCTGAINQGRAVRRLHFFSILPLCSVLYIPLLFQWIDVHEFIIKTFPVQTRERRRAPASPQIAQSAPKSRDSSTAPSTGKVTELLHSDFPVRLIRWEGLDDEFVIVMA